MRPLKPFLAIVSGLMTALFGAVFIGAQPGLTTAAPPTRSQPDLQTKSVVSRTEVVASRDAKPADKAPAPQLDAPTADFPESDTLRVAQKFNARVARAVPERIVDRRALSLVGIVELRI